MMKRTRVQSEREREREREREMASHAILLYMHIPMYYICMYAPLFKRVLNNLSIPSLLLSFLHISLLLYILITSQYKNISSILQY